MDDLEKQDWPIKREDLHLLEREIDQAETFLQQSKDLRQKSEEVLVAHCHEFSGSVTGNLIFSSTA